MHFSAQGVMFAFPCPPRESFPFVRARIEDGKFTPVIDKSSYKLDAISSAFDDVLQGQKQGNVVLEIGVSSLTPTR
jgi:NADPH:quinone reductase-like Zn-dependent oxidoreductase